MKAEAAFQGAIPMTVVRRLGPAQADDLVGASTLFDEPVDREAARAYLADDRNVCWLAYDGDRPVGFLRGTGLLQVKNRRRQMFLYEIAVAEDTRRHGIGRALVEALLEHCRNADFEEIFVFTDPSNEAAVRLYRSTGAVTETPADRMFVYQL